MGTAGHRREKVTLALVTAAFQTVTKSARDGFAVCTTAVALLLIFIWLGRVAVLPRLATLHV